MAKKCALCKNELPEYVTNEWAYRLGNNMYFCSYGCMQAKKSGILQKQAETFAKRKAEKEARAKAAEEAAKERRPQAEWTVVGKIDKEEKPMEKINEAAREQLTKAESATPSPVVMMVEPVVDKAAVTDVQYLAEINQQRAEIERKNKLIIENEQIISQLHARIAAITEERDAWQDGYNKLDKRCDSLLSTIDTLMAIIKEH